MTLFEQAARHVQTLYTAAGAAPLTRSEHETVKQAGVELQKMFELAKSLDLTPIYKQLADKTPVKGEAPVADKPVKRTKLRKAEAQPTA